MEILKLSDKKQWKNLLKTSPNDYDLLIYKFSPICSASSAIDVILDEWIETNRNNPHLKLFKIDVILSKSLSRRIAKDLNIKHESPQLIWLDKEMSVKFHASHYDITKEELDMHL